MREICSRYATSATTRNLQRTNEQYRLYGQLGSDNLAQFSGNTYTANNTRAKELLKECRERDKDLVRVPHPTLPKTWLLVSREKARIINAKQ